MSSSPGAVRARGVRIRWALRCALLASGALFVARAWAAEISPTPVLVQSAPGRFEIAAVDATAAHGVAALAEETWRALAAPLGLPAAFSLPVFVRLIDGELGVGETEPFTAQAESGGVVSLRIRWRQGGPPPEVVRRALVRGL
ncbi:MAG: hypothetical protein V4773_05420, partial [Verrucomicrobiota bacterium]